MCYWRKFTFITKIPHDLSRPLFLKFTGISRVPLLASAYTSLLNILPQTLSLSLPELQEQYNNLTSHTTSNEEFLTEAT